MRESIGTTWIFSLVITFTLIFTAFLSLALVYSKAYKIKNEIVTIIEKYEGVTTNTKCTTKNCKTNDISRYGSIAIINNFLKNSGYNAKGACYSSDPEIKMYGVKDLDPNSSIERVQNNNKKNDYYYCISYTKSSGRTCSVTFDVTVFYDFNLPVLGQIRRFSITGHTNEMYHPILDAKGEKSPELCK